jgi:Lamin Tail Domain/CotH kinase protein/Carbohydrate binding domain/Immunoglobulin domain
MFMNRRHATPLISLAALLSLASTFPARSATIPGLFNSGVDNNGNLLASGSVDPHWTLISSDDPSFPGPNAYVLPDNSYPIPPWVANGPNSKWISPQTSQATGNLPGDYVYRITFDLTGLEPSSAVITGLWTSDNAGPDVRVNGVSTGITSDGNFPVLGNPFTINSGFVDGLNTLDFVVNNASTTVNPTGFRVELSGTADLEAPPGTKPSIVTDPVSVTVGLLDPASFTVSAYGSRPLSYQWRFDGNPVSGATAARFTIANVHGADAGSYDVVVTNDSGSVTSKVATLGVVYLSPAQLSYEPLGPSTRRTGLTFSEIMYHPAPRTDGRQTEFVEIYNSNPYFEDLSGWRLSGDLDYTFPSNTVIEGNAFLLVAPAPADLEAVYGLSGVLGGFTNNLPNDGGTIRLRKRSGGIVLEVTYSDQPPWPAAADGAGHSLVLARPSYGENNPRAWEASAAKGGSPGGPDPVPNGPLENVVINEILAHSDLPLADYIELFNNSSLPADLSGCWLSDDPATNKFRIPDGTTLGIQGWIAFDETELGFALEANGETVYLVNSNETRVLNSLRFGGQANGVAFGRYPDGAPTFRELSNRTPGAANASPLPRDVVINEIMYHPISGDSDDEYVELFNRGAQGVNLGGWKFVDGISFTFPDNTILPAGGYLAVAKNAARLMTNYSGLSAANLIGNYGGTLANGGERLALAMPETRVITNALTGQVTTNTYSVVVNEVTYVDGGRWGRWSDGGGSSLELIDARADNRLASNWADSDETSKSSWTVVETTGVLDLGSGSANQLQGILFGAGEALVDDVEVLVSGANQVPNPGFESGVSGWFFQGTHSKSSWETSEGYNSAHSLHVRSSERGDQAANRVRAPLTSAPNPGQTATIRAKVRWLHGHPEILFRLKGNWLEVFGRLNVPANLGTPGAPNSQARPNAGPAIADVSHRPILPQPNEAIRVTARVSDPDGLASVTLRYRLDPDSTQLSVPMADDGMGGDALAGDGIYTGVIPGQANGKLVAFHIEAADGFTPSASRQFPDDAPARECLVRVGETEPPGAFGVYHVWLTEATVNTWATREKLSNENLDGTWVYGNSRIIYNVGGHYSGSSYTSPGYNSPVGNLCGYDFIFPADDPFLSTTHMVMDWPVRDSTNQREQLMFWFLEQFGLPNMYRRYVILFVNGNRRGTTSDDVQQPSGETVDEWFSNDNNGTLLKTDCWDEFNDAGDRETGCIDLNALELYTTTGGVKKVARYRWTWKPRAINGTANDYTDLFHLVDAANAPAAAYQSSMEGLADMEVWMRTFAMNDLASYWDAFGNPNAKNTYLYKPEHDTWKLMCWDFDVGLGVFNDPVDAPLFPTLNDDGMNRVYANPAWTRLYWCALAEGVNGFFQTGAGTPIDKILDAKYAAFQANGLGLADPSSIKSWISQRRAFLLNQLNGVAANFAVAGPDTVTTDQNLLSLTGTAPVQVHTLTVNGVVYPITWTTVNAWTLTLPVASGTSQLTVEGWDRFGRPVANASRTLTVTYTGATELAADSVVINEIMYHPIPADAEYLEIYNTSATYSFDLSGWRVNGIGYTFPPGSILTNGQFLVLAKNRAAFASAYGTGVPVFDEYDGNLDDDGETLTLFQPGGQPGEEWIVDRVAYSAAPPWPSSAAEAGLSLQLIDPKQDNSRVSNWSDGTGWRFFSVTETPSSTPSRFYMWLTNAGDVYLDDVELVRGETRGAGPNLLQNGDFETGSLAPWTASGNHSGSTASSDRAHGGIYSLHIVSSGTGSAVANLNQAISGVDSTSPYTLSFYFYPSSNIGLQYRVDNRFRNLSGLDVSPTFVSPGKPNSTPGSLPPYDPVWLNEVEPENISGIPDNAGDRDPWIELYNAGTSPLSLDSYFLANSYVNLVQWPFPPGATLQPGEFKLVWADAEPAQATPEVWHANFRLNPTEGAVALSRLINGAPHIVDFLNYQGIGPDQGYGSYPDGDAFFRRTLYVVTPAQTNSAAFPSPPLFINEWMAANASAVTDPADQDFDDWFELYNAGDDWADLEGYRLTDDGTNPAKYVVPAGIRVPPRGFLLVWADENTSQTRTNGALHVNFKLSATGEEIRLYAPNGQLVDAVTFGPQTDNVSEGRFPDGNGEPFFEMATFTPGAPNQIAGAATPLLAPPEVELGTGSATLSWTAEPGATYRLQYKDKLGDPEWMDVPGDVVAAGPTASKTDTTIPSVGQRFYRIMRVSP